MQVDTTILATDNYELASLIDKKKFFDKFLFEDATGHISLESAKLDSFDTIKSLVKFLLKSNEPLTELYKDRSYVIIDLTNQRTDIATFDDLDNFYQQWLTETKRNNSMDEYGMLLGFVSYLQRHKTKKFLLIIIDKE